MRGEEIHEFVVRNPNNLDIETEKLINVLNGGDRVVIVWNEGEYDEKFVIERLICTEFGDIYLGEWFSSSNLQFCSACGAYNKHNHSPFDVLYSRDTIRNKIYKALKEGYKVFVEWKED